MASADLMARLEASGLPYAPIRRPEDLPQEPHLAERGLETLTLPDSGASVALPRLPLEFDGARQGLTRDLPAIGADTEAVLGELGLDGDARADLRAAGVIA